jgi:hypothetical protein
VPVWWGLAPTVAYEFELQRAKQYSHALLAELDSKDAEDLVPYLKQGGRLVPRRAGWTAAGRRPHRRSTRARRLADRRVLGLGRRGRSHLGVRETYEGVEVVKEDGWVVLFRGKDAVLRAREEHVQSLEVSED